MWPIFRFLSCVFVWSLSLPILIVKAELSGADCGCLWQGSFSEVAPGTDLIILGTIQRTKGNSVDLDPEKILLGSLWPDYARVWMKTGDYCRPEPENFPVGSRWVMALRKINNIPPGGFNPFTPNESFGRKGDYILSSCGGFWLKVLGNSLTGNLVPGMPRFSHEPKMSPVLVEIVSAYLQGKVSKAALVEASRQQSKDLDTLILDTRSFLRGQEFSLPEKHSDPNS